MRELATTTIRQIWNQRLRWAQGWTQVSLRHLWQMLRLPHFNSRQKFGISLLARGNELRFSRFVIGAGQGVDESLKRDRRR